MHRALAALLMAFSASTGHAAEGSCSTAISVPQLLSGPARLADLDNDGYVDIVTSGEQLNDGFMTLTPSSKQLVIRYGRGDGTFEPSTVVADDAHDVLTGDFNGDGRIDLAFSRTAWLPLSYRSEVFVAFANGDRSYALPALAARGELLSLYGTADLVGDGIPEILVNGASYLSFLSRGPDSVFEAVAVSPSAKTRVAFADIDGDGELDLISEVYPRNGMRVFRGNEYGRFTASHAVGTRNNGHVITADLNGDGQSDLITFDRFTGLLEVFAGPITGAATAQQSIVTPSTIIDATPADFNGDGSIDVVATAGSRLLTFANDGRGNLSLAAVSGPLATAGRIIVADVDRDGALDLMVGDSLIFGNGDGTFQTTRVLGAGEITGIPIAVADIDGDGTEELITDIAVARLKPVGAATFELIRTNTVLWAERVLAAGDVHPAPGLEVITSDESSLRVYSRDGGIWHVVATLPVSKRAQAAAVVEGRIAFIVEGVLYLANGAATTALANLTIDSVAKRDGGFRLRSADMDRDGHEDLLVLREGVLGDYETYLSPTRLGGGDVSLFLGRGSGGFVAPKTVFSVGGMDDVVVGDFNGDGHRDLVISTERYLYGSGGSFLGVYFLEGHGDGSFAEAALIGPWPFARLAAHDLNRDGFDDVVVNERRGLSMFRGSAAGPVLNAQWRAGGGGGYTSWPVVVFACCVPLAA